MTENKKNVKKKVEQNDPNGSKLKSKKCDVLCGGMHQISVYRPSVIVDSHMHIQSGNCSTLHFLWKRLPIIRVAKPSRGSIDFMGMAIGYLGDLFKQKPIVDRVNRIRKKQNADGEYYQKNGLRQTVPQAKKKTIEVGDEYIVKRKQAHAFFENKWEYSGLCHLVLSGVVMTMDMEYAHINGYFGLKIYNPVYADSDFTKEPIHYWYPIPGKWKRRGNSYELEDGVPQHVPEEGQSRQEYEKFWKDVQTEEGVPGCYHDVRTNGVKLVRIMAAPCLTNSKETARYEQWKKQLRYTELAALKYPLKMLPMFHYDPRRWQLQGNSEVFKKVDLDSGGFYLGFKMYTAQGYRPWDIRRLPILKDFYAECSKRKTPIMNHCSPDGAFTFEREKYLYFVHPNDTDEDRKQKYAKPRTVLGATIYDPKEYFNDHFVSPDAWRKVLDSTVNGRPLKDLRLCLAHFGGNTTLGKKWGRQIIRMMKDYPNVYADISSSFANSKFRTYFIEEILKKDPDRELIKDRILFGTDWYLTLLDGVNYVEYCQKARDALKFDSSLWFRFTQYNPCRFYRLDEEIGRIASNIIKKRGEEEIKGILKPLSKTQKTTVLKEAYHIEKSSKPYLSHKESRWIV